MNRRGFMGALLASVLDPEKLLWVPGKKLISIPKLVPTRTVSLTLGPHSFEVGDVVTIWPPPVAANGFRVGGYLAVQPAGRGYRVPFEILPSFRISKITEDGIELGG